LFWKENAKGKKSYLRLETEDAALGDRRCLQRWWWLLPTASSGFPSVITCLCLSFSVFVFCVLCISGFNCCRVLVGCSVSGLIAAGSVGCSVFGSSRCICSLVFLLWFCPPFLSFSLGVLLPFINPADCAPSVLPLQDCYLPRTRSWARDVVLDWIESVADFPACWIGMEKTNTTVLPAAATFRQQWISPATTTFQAANGHFYFDPWTVGNSAIGP